MTQTNKSVRKPRITVSDIDHKRIVDLATGTQTRFPEVAEELLIEMDRAHVVAPAKVPANVVRMGSGVTFETDGAQARSVTLVYPGEADIEQNRISILTPIGAALIGLSTGQSINWHARDGRRHVLTVVNVTQPDSGSESLAS